MLYCAQSMFSVFYLGRVGRSLGRCVLWAGFGVLAVVGTQAWASSFPDWVREAAHQMLPAYPSDSKAVILLSDETYTVGADGRAVAHVRKVIEILRPQGRELAYPAAWYDKDSKITEFHVWSIDPAGHEYTVKDNEIADVGMPGVDGELYNDTRAKIADPPGRDPGGIIAYEYEKKERPYLAETNWEFQDDLPRLKQSFTLVLPPGYTYATTWAHHAKVDAIDLENQRYRWEMNNEAAIDLDSVPLAPSEGALAARMTVHYSGPGLAEPQEGNWTGIGEWITGLAKDREVASPEIAAKAAALTAGKTDFFDKAQAIADYVQKNVRYAAVEIGVGGYQPHFASQIYKGGYGDCKDKATLLVSMLSSVGIHASLVMVDTERGVVDPEDPSITGDHMIAAIEIPSGYESLRLHSVVTGKSGKRYLLVDPTWEKIPFGQIENNLQGSYAVLADGADSQAVRVPVMPPSLNSIRRRAKFKLAEDGTLTGAVTEARFGDAAESWRYLATHNDAKEQQRAVNHLVAEDFGAVNITGLNFTGADTLSKDMVTSFTLDAPHFATSTGGLLMVRPRVLGTYNLPIDHKTRTAPINLSEAMQGQDEFEIELPPGYVVDELPDPVHVDLGFATYDSKTVLEGRELRYSRTVTIRDVTLPASRYKDVQNLVTAIGTDEEGEAVLKRAPNVSTATTGARGGTTLASSVASPSLVSSRTVSSSAASSAAPSRAASAH